MACGCLAVGFNGIGGADLMIGSGREQNCILVENGNYPALGEALEEVMQKLVEDPRRYVPIFANGRSIAARFGDLQAEADPLGTCFRGRLQSSARASKGFG